MTKNLTEFEDWYLNKKGGKLMDKKKRAVRHKTSEWIRITLRVDPDNKNYIEDLCDNLGISQIMPLLLKFKNEYKITLITFEKKNKL